MPVWLWLDRTLFYLFQMLGKPDSCDIETRMRTRRRNQFEWIEVYKGRQDSTASRFPVLILWASKLPTMHGILDRPSVQVSRYCQEKPPMNTIIAQQIAPWSTDFSPLKGSPCSSVSNATPSSMFARHNLTPPGPEPEPEPLYNSSCDVIMVTSSSMKDMQPNSEVIYRPNAIRALCKIIDVRSQPCLLNFIAD